MLLCLVPASARSAAASPVVRRRSTTWLARAPRLGRGRKLKGCVPPRKLPFPQPERTKRALAQSIGRLRTHLQKPWQRLERGTLAVCMYIQTLPDNAMHKSLVKSPAKSQVPKPAGDISVLQRRLRPGTVCGLKPTPPLHDAVHCRLGGRLRTLTEGHL